MSLPCWPISHLLCTIRPSSPGPEIKHPLRLCGPENSSYKLLPLHTSHMVHIKMRQIQSNFKEYKSAIEKCQEILTAAVLDGFKYAP